MNPYPSSHTGNCETDEFEIIHPRPIMNVSPFEKRDSTFAKSKTDVSNGKVSSVDSGVETGNDSNDSTVTQMDAKNQSYRTDWKVLKAFDCVANKYNQMALMRTQSLPPSPSLMQSVFADCATDDINKPQSSLSSDDKEKKKDDLCAFLRTIIDTRYADTEHKLRYGDHQVQLPFCGKMVTVSPPKGRKFSPYSHYHISVSRLQRRMFLAAETNNICMVEALLKKGLSPNNSDEKGRTALHYAASRGFTEIVDLLLKHGANANCKDANGSTPLHLAAATGKIAVVTLLVAGGTDPLSTDCHGNSPLQLAKSNLRFVQKSGGDDVKGVKSEVHEVVNMLTICSIFCFGGQVEALSSFCSRLTLSNTSDEVKNEVQNLLTKIDNIQLNS